METGAGLTFKKWVTILVVVLVSPLAVAQTTLDGSTFEQFAYENGTVDMEYTELLRSRTNYSFPNSSQTKVASYVTKDNPRTVVDYYAQLSGQRFLKNGDKFIYVFSRINEVPANRIEIQPIPHLRIPKSLWPTRINLYIIKYDIKDFLPRGEQRSLEELRKLAGPLTFDGTLRDDVAMLETQELGPNAICFVVETKESWERVYQFFRRRYGRLLVRPARDGDIWVRNFEFDGTRTAQLERKDMELFIRVDENPIVTDQNGNSQVFLGSTFIKYIFWKKTQETG